MAKTFELTSGNPRTQILRFTLPVLMGNILQQTYALCDAAIVGRFLGINALASVGASASVVFLILGFCSGCSSGFGIPVAQKYGAEDYVSMRGFISSGYRLGAIISVSLAVITCLLCAHILRWMRTPQNIIDDAYIYLLITFIGIPFTFFYNLLASILRAVGDSKTPFYFLLLATVLNIALDLFCILALGWGVLGAGVATVFSQALSMMLCYIYMYKRHGSLITRREGEEKFSPRKARTLLGVGVPMGLQFSITAIGNIMLQSANNALGTACVAAFTAALRVKMFVIAPFESLGMAMATYAGQNYGAGKPSRIWQGVRQAELLMMVYALTMFSVIMLFSEEFCMMFISSGETEVIALAAQYLHTCSYFYPFIGTLCILRYTLQGVGYTGLALGSGISEMLARTAVSLLAVPVWGYTAVCFGDPMAWTAAALFLMPAAWWTSCRIKRKFSQAYS